MTSWRSDSRFKNSSDERTRGKRNQRHQRLSAFICARILDEGQECLRNSPCAMARSNEALIP
jgi:hypothetical protein